jgi:hypothetical protein
MDRTLLANKPTSNFFATMIFLLVVLPLRANTCAMMPLPNAK